MDPVELGAVAFGKGSSTNESSEAPFWMRPLLRDQPETMKDCVSELERVAVGNGMLVLVVSEYRDARVAAGVIWAATLALRDRARATARVKWNNMVRLCGASPVAKVVQVL